MAKATQSERLLSITTPLGEDYLLLNKLSAKESLSDLYEIDVELVFDEEEDEEKTLTPVDISQILGQKVGIEILQEDGGSKSFRGIVCQFTQLARDVRFTYYRAKIVPHIWKLTQIFRSRIFQQISVPDILKEVLDGYEIKDQLKGEYKPRNYCVQYRETDFDFISRLMADEGIYYYFDHSGEGEKMVLRDEYLTPEDCPGKSDIPIYDIDLENAENWESSILEWLIDYRLMSGSYETWDYQSQLPGKKLDASTTSRFNFGGNQDLKIYNYPGRYGGLYDGIDKSGGERSGDLDTIFQDNQKNAKNTILSLDSQHQIVNGFSDCCSFTAGYRFNLKNHPNTEYNISYIVRSVIHEAVQNPAYLADERVEEDYKSSFTCIPHGEGHPEYRPEKKTTKPLIQGSQTAFIVGPEGEEIFTDKYGRVKCQFHWDQYGQADGGSSCWVPVAQGWAGNKWGMVFIPRIGMEVVVDFLDGDPDRPLVRGCVYNPGAMPPYDLPDEKTKSTIKSDSSKGGGGFNEFRFEDKKGEEQIFIHGQKDLDMRIKNDRRELIGNDRHTYIRRDKREHIKRDEHKLTERDEFKEVRRDFHYLIGENSNHEIGGDSSQTIDGALNVIVGDEYNVDTTAKQSMTASEIVLDAQMGITLKCGGGNFIKVHPAGVDIVGSMVKINSGGAAGSATTAVTISPNSPEEAHRADNADPGSKSPTYKNQVKDQTKAEEMMYGSAPSHDPNSKKNEEKKSWVEIQLEDEEGNPVPGERYLVTLPDGSTVASGSLDSNGYAKVTNIDPGNCKVTFPDMDGRSWNKK